MTYKMYAALIASLGVALALVSNDSFGGSAAIPGAHSVSPHPSFHPSTSHARLRQKDHNIGGKDRNMRVLAAEGSGFWGWNGGPDVEITQSIPSEIHYKYTREPLWDSAHRFYPPLVGTVEPAARPTELAIRPLVPGCPEQTVTAPGGDGKERTISIVRCY